MAFGVELVLGFTFENFKDIHSLIKLELNEENQQEIIDAFEQYGSQLKKAHYDTLIRYGFTDVEENNLGFKANTPLGKREFSSFDLQWFFDPYELGDTIETSIIGISLSGRYVPTYLDWKDPHGGISNIAINKTLIDMVEIAKSKIVKVIPEFEKAELIIREEFY